MNMSLMNEMISKIEDPKLRAFYSDIATGKVKSQVKCMSDICKGAVVGYIMSNGVVTEKDTSKKGILISGLRSSRMRIDNVLGFSCYCGNSSILAPEEEGIIKASTPTASDLNKIATKLKKRKNYTEQKFIIEEVK